MLEFYAHLPTVIWDSLYPTIHIRGVDVPADARSVNIAFGVPEVPYEPYMDKLREKDMTWLRNTLVDEIHWKKSVGPLQRDLPATTIQPKLRGG